MLFDFAERYSQDAFILEMASELNEDFQEDKIKAPLTTFNEDGTTNYPQVSFTFAKPLTAEQIDEITTRLEALRYKPAEGEEISEEELFKKFFKIKIFEILSIAKRTRTKINKYIFFLFVILIF